MKKLLLVAVISLGFIVSSNEAHGPKINVEISHFYSALQLYGEWIEIDYNLHVWRPANVRRNWRPYVLGSWAWTDYGWYWESNEPFGWATYHYGKWFYDDFYGWVWLPDNEWGPAWVEWRYSNDHIGWAPMYPYNYEVRIGYRFSVNRNRNHIYWNFVNYPQFYRRNVNVYIINYGNNDYIFNNTKYRTNYDRRNNYIINEGVDRKFVENKAGYRIAKRKVEYVTDYNSYKNRKDNNDVIKSFKPKIGKKPISITKDYKKTIEKPTKTTERNIELNKKKYQSKDYNSKDNNDIRKNKIKYEKSRESENISELKIKSKELKKKKVTSKIKKTKNNSKSKTGKEKVKKEKVKISNGRLTKSKKY